jgi:rhodanese-related sulfurtransferase
MHPALFIGLCVTAAVVAGWYVFEGSWDRSLFHTAPGQVFRNGSAAEAKAFLEAHPDTQILDVRSGREFAAGALPGAIHIPLGDPGFAGKAGHLDRNRPVLVYCAGGYRSRKAVALLKPMRFTTVQHLHRGYHSWKLAGLPVTAPTP